MGDPAHVHTPLVPTGRAKDWTEWVEWVRTALTADERRELLSTFTTEQAEYLVKEDYVWARGLVVWMSPDHTLQRLRFTHGAYFRTKQGEFYIDSEGSTRKIPAVPVMHREPIVYEGREEGHLAREP